MARRPTRKSSRPERVGTVVDALLDRPLQELLAGLNLHSDVCDALLRRIGKLGALLDLVEVIERVDVARIRHDTTWTDR